MPDLKWDTDEILVAGDCVVVLGEGLGTPAGDFMGVPHTGKSFRILVIDIHTMRDGRMVGRPYHVEDSIGASRQLNTN